MDSANKKHISFKRSAVVKYFISRFYDDVEWIYDVRHDSRYGASSVSMGMDGRCPKPHYFHDRPAEYFMFSAVMFYILLFEKALVFIGNPDHGDYYILNDFSKLTGIPAFLFGMPGLHPAIEHLTRGAGLFHIDNERMFLCEEFCCRENFIQALRCVRPVMENILEAFFNGCLMLGGEMTMFSHHERRKYIEFIDKCQSDHNVYIGYIKAESLRFEQLLKDSAMENGGDDA